MMLEFLRPKKKKWGGEVGRDQQNLKKTTKHSYPLQQQG